MKELIRISTEVIGTEKVNSVNARDLHVELEIKKDFTDWIATQIQRAGLQKDLDYIIILKKSDIGRPRKEYIINTNSAKHIAMMSQGRKASQIRDYFIEAEKALHVKADREVLKPNLDYEGGKVAHVIHGFKHEINPTAFLNVALIKKMEDMFGINNVRDFYSKLLGVRVDPILLLGDEIVAFCDEWIFKDKHSFTCNDDIYDGYVLWLRSKGDKAPIEKMNFSRRFSKLNRDIKVQKRFGKDRKMGYKLLLKGDVR